MALSAGYVVRETAANLKRNALMSVAAVVTMAVGLLFFGSSLLWQTGVERQTGRWKNGVELSIFMHPGASEQQLQAVGAELDADPEVKSIQFINKPAAYAEMKEIFANQPEVLEAVGEQDAPPSFRVVPVSAEQVEDVGARFKDKPGVGSVVYAKETIDILLKVTNSKRGFALIVAVLALISALLVILNTVRMAIFSRRREVAIMKLVGATNWFIRIPFMLEGMVQGVAGAIGAFLVIFAFRNPIMSFVNDAAFSQFARLYATTGDTIRTGIWLLLVGMIMGAISSIVAVRSYLDV